MAMANPYEKYQQQSVMTATPGELTLMLYNGCIRFIKQAKLAIDKKDIEGAGKAIIRSQNIILELMATLNGDYEISHELYNLYEYIYQRLVDANISKNMAPLDEVLELLEGLRDTWAQAIKIHRRETYEG